MKRKIGLWIGLVVLCIVVGLGIGMAWKYMSPSSSPVVKHSVPGITKPTPTVSISPTPTVPPWKGMRLVIPAIEVNAPVEPVSVLPGGQLEVPKKNQWEGVGWFEKGPQPGARGSAVIDGHLDRPGGVPAVFWRLHELHPGDTVQIVSASGKTLHFRVKAVQTYRPQDAPINKIFTDTSGTYLNLITCAGEWIAAEHQTSLRLVVYTTLEKS